MSELLNLSNIFAESTSYNVISEVRSGEIYMESCFSYINEFNKNFNNETKILYNAIQEAEDRASENEAMCEYMCSIEKATNNLINKVNDMVSRFIIKIDNMVDAESDFINNNELISKYKPFSYRFYKFEKIDDPSYPKMNPLSIYNKEFDYIGQLMQDLGPAATNQAKLGVIATVYNKLTNGCSGSISKKCIKDILNDDCEISKFAHELYEEFKDDDPKDITVDKSRLYDIKLSLTNYQQLVNSGVSCAENLTKQFSQITKSINDIICGNKKNNLKIDSPTDGIKNTTYKLDTYTMNQLDLFMKCKVNQLTEMINIYIIALSVKLDAIVDYFDQCKDIIKTAEMNCSCEENPNDDSMQDNNTNNIDTYDDNQENQTDSEDDLENGENDSDNDLSSDDKNETESSDDEYELGDMESSDSDIPDDDENTTSESEPSDSESKDSTSLEDAADSLPDLDNDVNDVKEACDRFESYMKDYLYEMNIMCSLYENFNVFDDILDYVTEEEKDANATAANDNDKPEPQQQKSSVIGKDAIKKTKMSIWKGLVNKTAEVWNKFKTNMIANIYEKKIGYLDKNKKLIAQKALNFEPDSKKLMPIIHEDKLNIKIPDLNFASLEKDLVDEDTFFANHFKEIHRDKDQSVSEAVKNSIVSATEYYHNMNQLDPMKLYEFCKKIPKIVDELSKNTQIMDKGRRNAENIAKTLGEQSSLFEDTMLMYFNEFDTKSEKEEQDEKNGKESGSDDKSSKLIVYFKTCGTVMVAEMNACNRIFKEYYAYLKYHIKKHGGDDSQDDNQQQQTQTSDNTPDTKFN